MSKPSIVKFRMPSKWVAAIAVLTVAIAGGAALFSASGAKNVQAMNQSANKAQPTVSAEQRGRVRASLDALPLAFEANQGQTDPQVKYTARGNGYSVFLTASDTVFAITSAKHTAARPSRIPGMHSRSQATEKMQSAAIDMRLVGGNLKPEIIAGNEVPGVINYYAGNDPKNWHTGVKQYSSVSYRDVYPGVNIVFHGAQRQLEFDFVVSPGADPKTIGLGFKGAQRLAIDARGNLVLASSAGDVVLHKPVAYQEKDGKREIVAAAFQVKSGNKVGLNLGAYDRGQELVIDPSLSYSTYLGGTAEDDAYAIAIDGTGNAYVTGQTKSTDFPTVPANSTTNSGGFDVFVSKIAADGSSLIYSTYIGSDGNDSGNAIAVDGLGNAFVAGGTSVPSSIPFPTTPGAFQTTFMGGNVDAFVLELAPSGGSLVFSTYLGGNGDDVANGIAIDTTGVYVVGSTRSNNFPLQSALQSTFSGNSAAFVTKLNTSGTSPLLYSTYLGGGTNDFASAVAVASGNAYITGATTATNFPVTPTTAFQPICGTEGTCNGGLQDAFVTVLNSSGGGPVYSTYLGGQANDQGLGIAVDTSGNAYVTGLTQSSQFPVKSAAQPTFGGGTQDAFVAEFNPSGSPAANTLVYSTFLGGSLDDAGNGVAVDGSKNAYVVGQTNSSNFPTAAPTQSALGGGTDGFVSEISASGSLIFSTYLGGALNDNTNAGNPLNPVGAVAVDSSGANIYVAGNTLSSPFPGLNGFQTTYRGLTDAFVAKYSTGSSSGGFTVSNGALSNTSGHAGVSATSTITVGSTGGFNAPVALTCAVSPAVTKGPTCNFSNPSVTPPANSTTTSTLNVATTTASAMAHPANGRGSGFFYALFLPVFGLALLGAGIGSSGQRRRKFLGLVITGMVLMCLLLLPACGGSSGGGGGGGGTPTGTYTITVTGTNGTTVVTGTPALTLTIN